jgi:hypothetical protein
MKKIPFLLFFSFLFFQIRAQSIIENMNSYSPPSPEAASLLPKNGVYALGYYNGRLSYSASLLEVSMNGINFDLGLRYSTAGFKVQDVPGSVGLGWGQNFGGVITRYVEGLPDEEGNGYCGPNHIGARNSGTLDDDYFNKITSAEWDSQPDKFYFSFMGVSGSMRLDPNGKPTLESTDSGIKIEYNPFNNINGRMNGGAEEWIIRDQNGNRYFFGGSNLETTSSTAHGEAKNTTKTFISSWYISKIITANNQTILFNYITGSAMNNTYYVNVKRTNEISGACSYSGPGENFWNENVDVNIPAPLYLSEIKTFDNRTVVGLNYGHNREDLINGKALTEVTLTYNGQLKKKIGIDYSYFLSTDGSGTKRLKLDKIREIGKSGGENIMFHFVYNETTVLPARNSIKTDYWGYYNKNYGTSNIEGHQNGFKGADYENTMACVLTKVNNKTGGTLYFEYELNDYNKNGNNETGGGLRVKRKYERTSDSQQLPDLINEEYSYKIPGSINSSGQQYLSQNNRELVTEMLTIFGFGGTLWVCVFKNHYTYSEPLISIFDINETAVGYSYVGVKRQNGTTLYNFSNYADNPDIYDQRKYETAIDQENANNTLNFNIRPQFPATSFSFARGKIKNERLLDPLGVKVKEVIYNYSLTSATDPIIGIKAFAQGFINSDKIYNFGKYVYANRDYKLIGRTEKNFVNGVERSSNTESLTYTAFAKNLLLSKTVTDLAGNTSLETFSYPFDQLGNPVFADMVSKNRIVEPIGHEKYLNGILTERETKEFAFWGAGITAPSLNKQAFGAAPLATKIIFNNYDEKGNLLESEMPHGVKESYIWGYGKEFLVAKIINSGYAQAEQLIDMNQINQAYNYTDAQNQSELNKLRLNLPEAQVSTILYDPLIGMSSQMDSKGFAVSYEYDEFNRLMNIKDRQGNIKKNFSYHYHPPYVYNDAQFGSFTKQGCPINYIPESVAFMIQANTVFSVNSKQEANSLALAELNLKGQENANLVGRCRPPSNLINYSYSSMKHEICSFMSTPIAIQFMQGYVRQMLINDPNYDERIYGDEYLTYAVPTGYYVVQGSTNIPVSYQFIEDGYVKFSNTCGQDDPIQFAFSPAGSTVADCGAGLIHRYAYVSDPSQALYVGVTLSLPFGLIEDGYYLRDGMKYTVVSGVIIAEESCAVVVTPNYNFISMTRQFQSIVGICQSDNYNTYFYNDPTVGVGTILYKTALLNSKASSGYYYDGNKIYIVVSQGVVYGIQTCQEIANGVFLAHPPFEPDLEPVTEMFSPIYSTDRTSMCNPLLIKLSLDLYSTSGSFNMPQGIGAPIPIYFTDSAQTILAPDGYYSLHEQDPMYAGEKFYYLKDGMVLFSNWCELPDPHH